MARYAAFGFQLDSEIALPELPEIDASSAPAWRVERGIGSPSLGDYISLGTDTVYADVKVSLSRSADAFRVVFDDSGTFDVIGAERRIRWYPGIAASEEAVRADLLGRVMAVAAHADDALALHASAVSIGGKTIALLGPKRAGKSTLALALVQARQTPATFGPSATMHAPVKVAKSIMKSGSRART